MPYWITSLAGIGLILLIAYLASTNRKAISLRVVGSAFALQIAIAVFVFYVPFGRTAIESMSSGVSALLGYSQAGINMVFGPLASDNMGVIFAVRVLPILIFFSSLVAVLYHVGIMQRVVAWVGGALQKTIGTAPVESLNATANIFVSQTEAPFVIKPYLSSLSKPQLFAIMVSGMASVSGSVLAAYAQFGINIEYLLIASFMAAPGGLLMAKIIMPDDNASKVDNKDLVNLKDAKTEHSNVIMAAAVGAQDGLMLAVNIGGMLIAFVSLIALLNGIVGYAGGLVGIDNLSVEMVLGYIFAPVMFMLDIPWNEAQTAGAIFGEKLILNEFVAYISLGEIQDTLSPRTAAITTFALCGFANLSSIAIMLGALGSLIKDRMSDIAALGLRAVLAASLSNLMSAALAGLLISPT
ncbi:NupC/NupG family nucleoside CNT transporter [Kordiimonas sp. SCSIO 12610]|uniref:NupC/NupG family nucleoside CNT transporter n=1 Tax=Kordiimonas sp. SCSIO 12610 TaxID=2829597 RepID=UPI00210E8894|nr:NupC/NupG family nucleoside CNT transporter [Kordiimonas sp. SCSIO 12610]UTW55642.1 NupC/NupG family nucleoside CNT transporter [Kordiimonas sp. SCSIO 12610]